MSRGKPKPKIENLSTYGLDIKPGACFPVLYKTFKSGWHGNLVALTVRGNEVKVSADCDIWTSLENHIAECTALMNTLKEAEFSINTFEEYGSQEVRFTVSGWRDLTKEELVEVDKLRSMYNHAQDVKAANLKQLEIEKARKILREAGEL